MNRQNIIMNFTVPPSNDDIQNIAETILDALPEELVDYCDSIAVHVEDIPDESLEEEFDLEDPYDMMALFRKGNEISPGVESTTKSDDDMLILFRRCILDLWGETEDDLNEVVRQVIIEELGDNFDFTDDEIEDMTSRHHQGLL